MEKTPGPPPWWTVLNFYRNPLAMFATAQKTYGDFVRFEAAGYELFQVTDPQLSQIILKGEGYDIDPIMDDPFTGHGLATNTGESWTQQRRLLQPLFHAKHFEAWGELISGKTQTLLDKWQGRTELDIWPELLRLHHDILGKIALGIEFSDYPEALEALMTIRAFLSRRFQALVPLPENWPLPRNQRYHKARIIFKDFMEKQFAQPKGLMAEMLETADPKTGYRMSRQQVQDEIHTVFFNGYEDPAATLAWGLYLLAQNPGVEEKLRAELDAVLQGKSPSYEDMSKLSYTRQVIDEILRLYPPTWSILRTSLQENQLGDYPIPQGASVMVNIYLLHRHAGYWNNPEGFQPERFTEGEFDGQGIYLPFGAGPRRCIGQGLASMEIRLVLVMLLQRYRFSLLPGQQVVAEAESSLKPRYGLRLGLSATQL
jgi:cytochrome P450